MMREEEKLARDVYRKLGEKWNYNIFNNISESEQTHTDAIKVLIDRYGIDDPVKSNELGEFTNPEFTDLYNDLVEQGNASLYDALIVGATVEDLDIKDLSDLSENTDKPDILITYENLSKGSRNHLRAYVRQIESNGGTYSPQYISQEEFDSIVNSQQEKGRIK